MIFFEHFQTSDSDRTSGQLHSACWILEKNPNTDFMANEWLNEMQHYNLIDDSPSKTPNHPSFRENRHDQSIFSCLLKKIW
jgi:hypothetical protein